MNFLFAVKLWTITFLIKSFPPWYICVIYQHITQWFDWVWKEKQGIKSATLSYSMKNEEKSKAVAGNNCSN
jgi:hypothetical protein